MAMFLVPFLCSLTFVIEGALDVPVAGSHGLLLMMLSGGMSPVESQPPWIQAVSWLLPSRHYVSFMPAIVYRGAGLEIVWKEFATVMLMGVVFLSASLLVFRRSIATTR